MARLEKLSNISWKQPFIDRKKELHLFTTQKDVSKYCNLKDGTKRLLNIKFESHFNIDIVDYFQITSGEEISFPVKFQRLIEPIIWGNPKSFFIVTVLDSKTDTNNQKLIEQYSTTGSATIDIRIGQSKFRESLITYWNSECSISNVNIKELLKASHIKPWKDSNDKERLDKYNGLLLNPMIDELFDKGYITFNDNGNIQISKVITNPSIFNIDSNLKLKKVEKQHKVYLEFHRKNKFKG